MSRVVNFLTGSSNEFLTSYGSWGLSSGSAILTASGEKQYLSNKGSLKIQPVAAGTVAAQISNVSIDSDYLGWALKFSTWVWSLSDVTVTASLTVTNGTQITTTKTVKASTWTLVTVAQPSATTQYGIGALGYATVSVSFAAATTASVFYLHNPVLATPDAIVYNTFNNQVYYTLPDYLRDADITQTNPTVPLLRFLDVVLNEAGNIYDLWEEIQYIAPDTYGIDEQKSMLVDPATAPVEWLSWLAMILGVTLRNPPTGFTSWGGLEAGLDANADTVTTWTEWFSGGASAAWSSLQNYAPDTASAESEYRWQVSSGVYGINAGTTDAIKQAAQHVLSGEKLVVVNTNVGGDPWLIEVVTVASETPDVVAGSSATLLEVVSYAVPAGFNVTHRVTTAGEILLDEAVLWLDASRYSAASPSILTNYGTGGRMLNASFAAGASAPIYVPHTGTNYFYTPGTTTGNQIQIADSAATQISGDMEIVTRFSMPDWTPTVAKWYTAKRSTAASATYGRSWLLGVDASGKFYFYWSANGLTENVLTSASVPPLTDGTTYWTKVVFDADNGSGGNTASFYWAPDSTSEPTTWNFFGSQTQASVIASIWNSGTPVTINGWVDGGADASASYYRYILRNGFGASATTVVDIDFTTAIVSGAQTGIPFTGTAANDLFNAPAVTNLGSGGAVITAQPGATAAVGTDDPIWLGHAGYNYLYIPNIAGNSVSGVDVATPTTSLSVRMAVDMDTWRPTGNHTFMSHYASGTPDRSWLFWNTVTTGLPALLLSTNGSVPVTITGDVPFPPVDGIVGIRADWTASPAEVKFYTKTVTEATAAADLAASAGWTQLGTTRTSSVPATALFNSTQLLRIGAHSSNQDTMAGKVWAAYAVVDGTTVLDANFTTGLTSATTTSFVESSANAATLTINRPASSRRSTVVTQPCWLFGGGNYMQILDNNLLDFGATDSFTVFLSLRSWGPVSNGLYMQKIDSSNNGPGWSLSSSTTTYTNIARLDDKFGASPTPITQTGASWGTAGTKNIIGFVVDKSDNTLKQFGGATVGASTSIVGLGSLENGQPVRIGVNNALASSQDFELFGAAIWRRALTSAEISTLNDYYQGTITPAGTALLQQATFWIDANLSKQAAGVIRPSTGLKAATVTRPTLLFGLSKYASVPHSELLNFYDTESFTAIAIVRNWNTAATGLTWLAKRNATVASDGKGWALRGGFSSVDIQIAVDDGPNGTSTTFPFLCTGSTLVAVGTVDRSTGKLLAYTGSVAGTETLITGYESLANTQPLYIGANGGDLSATTDMEFLGAAVFRRVLTSAEIAKIAAHYS